jgi:hypothetical protein
MKSIQSASVKQVLAESFMDDDIETSQSSQESESDHDIGMKAFTYSVSTQVQDWKKCIQLA